jgi:hypothetical protein
MRAHRVHRAGARGRREWVAILALASLTAIGCSAGQYAVTEGQSMPRADMAALHVIEYRQAGAVWNAVIKDVDGKRPPFLFRETQETRSSLLGASTGPGKAIELSPGDHSLRVGIYWAEFPTSSVGNPFNGHCTLLFEAAPGGRYELRSNYWRTSDDGFSFGSRDWSAQVVDAATQQVVSTSPCQPIDD